ncbi:MAG: LamG-like jellyroll fold domain-containing protein, partial [Planctomycetota bacterium]
MRTSAILMTMTLLLTAGTAFGADLLMQWSLDEGSGTTAGDGSGNGRDGSISGAVWSSPGYDGTGYCLDFDGADDTVTDADAENYLNGLDAITVSIWVNSDVTGTDAGFLDTEDPDGKDDTLGIRYDADGWGGDGTEVIKVAISTTGGQLDLESSSYAQVTDWQHIAVTWSSGNQLALFIDGVEDTPTYNEAAVSGTVNNVEKLLLGMCAKDSSSAW